MIFLRAAGYDRPIVVANDEMQIVIRIIRCASLNSQILSTTFFTKNKSEGEKFINVILA